MAQEDHSASATPASQAASVQPSALPFRPDAADVGFPWAGASLLLVLIVVAVAVKWRSSVQRSGAVPAWLARWAGTTAATVGTAAGGDIHIEASVRLDAQTQLHVVRWGDRRLLLATSSNMAPVVVDRSGASDEDGAKA